MGALMPGEICLHPGCGTVLHAENRHGWCRKHMHRSGQCRCASCKARQTPSAALYRLRVRSRAELVELGLLPELPVFVGAVR